MTGISPVRALISVLGVGNDSKCAGKDGTIGKDFLVGGEERWDR